VIIGTFPNTLQNHISSCSDWFWSNRDQVVARCESRFAPAVLVTAHRMKFSRTLKPGRWVGSIAAVIRLAKKNGSRTVLPFRKREATFGCTSTSFHASTI
jgi:hypothetical protein